MRRPYIGTAGRVEESQVGVLLALARSRGRAFADREPHPPGGDAARRTAAAAFATEPALARRMLDRAFAAGLRPNWVRAGEAYGNDPEVPPTP